MKISQRKIGAILSYIVIALNMFIGIAYTPFLIRKLGQAEYGLYSIIYSVISYLTVMDMGFGNAIIIYTARYINQKDKQKQDKLHGMFFGIYWIIGILAGIIGLILYFNINLLFENSMTIQEIEKAKIMMLILVGNLILTFPLSIFGYIIIAHEKFIISKIIKIIQIIMQPLLMIFLLFLGYKSIAMVVVLTFSNIFCLVLNAIICIKNFDVKLKFKGIDFSLLKEIFAYSFYIFLNQIIDKVNWNLDHFILGSIAGTLATAVYSVAGQLNTMYLNFSTAISGVMLPKITKMEDNKSSNEEFTKVFISTGRIQYILMALIITGYVLFGKAFINLWVGKSYEEAYYIGCLLMIPLTIPLIQNIGLSILQAKNLYKYRTIIFFFIAIVNVALSIPLTKLYGGIGAACGTALSLLVGQGLILNIYYHKKVGINIIEFWKNILKMTIPVVLSVCIGYGLCYFIKSNSIIILGIQILIYTIIYGVLMWLFAMNEYEKNIIKKPLNKLLSKVRG
ncbi:MAG: oligosaccharide flippase family protein [Clostridium sp.]|nr:oligosaccharide flippase family protein [Clostridium sp.]